MKERSLLIALLVLFALPSVRPAYATGIVAHMEIAERARQIYLLDGAVPYGDILRRYPDSFRAGAIFPDWGFAASLLEKGETAQSVTDASEEAHWTLFYDVATGYLRDRPKPWDPATEKLAAFLLGALAHSVTDLYWHNQDCAQKPLGLLQAMANDDFSKDYAFVHMNTVTPPPPELGMAAHTVGDAGSDVLAWFGSDLSWMPKTLDAPVEALVEIYRQYDLRRPPGKPELKVTREQLLKGLLAEYVYCQVFRSAESNPVLRVIFDRLYFPFFAERSRFLVEQFLSYPSGGADETAVLASYSWPALMKWFTEKPAPNLPPYHLLCPGGTAQEEAAFGAEPSPYLAAAPSALPPEIREAMKILAGQVEIRPEPGGVLLTGPDRGAAPVEAPADRAVYAYLGSSVAATPELLIAGAPGYSAPGKPRAGAVLLRQGRLDAGRIALSAPLLRTGPEAYGRFGQAVALVDLNADGKPDLVVSAPDTGAESIRYRGKIFVYFNTGNGFSPEPDLVLEPDEDQARFGWVLGSADCNGDGIPDLIVGSPFASGKGGARQGGQVAIYLASPQTVRGSRLRPAWTARGERANDAFGSAFAAGVSDGGQRILVVGAPGVKAGGRQGVGRIYGYTLEWNGQGEPAPRFTLTGTRRWARLGSALALGDPRGRGGLLLAAASPTDDRDAKRHAGSVVLLPVSALKEGQSLEDVPPVARFRGTQAFARFGWHLEIADVDGDGVADLLVSEPLRKTDSGPGAGAAYVWFGGPSFPTGDADPESAPWKTVSTENRAGLGSALATSPGKVILGAERSSQGARLGGAVLIFAPRR
jgi:hypothetical protein